MFLWKRKFRGASLKRGEISAFSSLTSHVNTGTLSLSWNNMDIDSNQNKSSPRSSETMIFRWTPWHRCLQQSPEGKTWARESQQRQPLGALLIDSYGSENQVYLDTGPDFIFSDGSATWNPTNQNPELTSLGTSHRHSTPTPLTPHTPPYRTNPTSLFQW